MKKSRLKSIAKGVALPVFNACYRLLMAPAQLRPGRRLFGPEELSLIHKALLSQNLFSIDGTMIPAFERAFAAAYGVPYAVACTSGTASIHLALGALDLNPGDEVITAPITDLGTIVPILYQNAIPVFADIDETYTMDPLDVERKITSRTRAIIAIHLFGNPCDMDALMEISKRHQIPLIEDCAQAHMTQYKGRYVGSIGDIGCFSFQQSKHMTTGEGGVTVTSNKEYYERMKCFVDKGWARKGWGPRAYLFLAPNYRPTELMGAVGLAQLKKVEGVVRKRHVLGEYMTELLSRVDGITCAPVTPGAEHSYWLYPMAIPVDVDLNRFAQCMREEKAWVSAGYTGKPIYLCAEVLTEKRTYGDSRCPFSCRFVEREYEYKEGLCLRAEEILKHLICVPLDESWEKKDVQKVVDAAIRVMGKLQAAPIAVRAGGKASRSNGRTAPEIERKVRIGIVGCGQMGRWHLDAYKRNPGVQVAAFADTDASRANRFAAESGGRAYDSHRAMLEGEKLDGISLCTVPSTHKGISLDFLDARVHVLCEKPLATSTYDAREMIRKAEEKDLLLLTAFKFRFFDEVHKAKEIIEKGGLGHILNFRLMFGGHMSMDGTWYAMRNFSGGGVIMDNGPHAIDLIRYLLGEVESVTVQTAHHRQVEVEDTAMLTFFLCNGPFGSVDLSWNSSVPSKTYLELYGEDGAILMDLQGLTCKYKTWEDWKRIPNRVTIEEAFARQINYFVRSIQGDRSSSILTNEDGLKSQIIVEAAYESVKRDSKVVVPKA